MIIPILIAGAILRIINLDQSFWLDEAIGAIAIQEFDLKGLITEFTRYDFHPPGYYVLIKFWASFFGTSEIGLRSLSVIFGVLTIYVVYKIADQLKINKGLAALLIATSPLHIYYSQEARMYPLTAFFSSLSVFLFLKILKKESLLIWLGFSLSTLLLMSVDYLPVFFLPIFIIYIFTKRNLFKKVILAFIPLMVLSIFWIPVFFHQVNSARNLSDSLPRWKEIIGSASIKELSLVWVKFIIGRITFMNKILYTLFVIVVSLPFVVLIYKGLKNPNRLILILWVIVPLVLSFTASFFIPAFSYFRLIFILPGFYLLVASGVKGNFGRLMVAVAVLINLVCVFIYFSNSTYWREDWRGATNYLKQKIKEDEIALFSFSEPVASFKWYASDLKSAGSREDIKTILLENSGVWYFEYLEDIADPGRRVLQLVKEGSYEVLEEKNFHGVGKITHLRIRK